jgi:hypothetical protein
MKVKMADQRLWVKGRAIKVEVGARRGWYQEMGERIR